MIQSHDNDDGTAQRIHRLDASGGAGWRLQILHSIPWTAGATLRKRRPTLANFGEKMFFVFAHQSAQGLVGGVFMGGSP